MSPINKISSQMINVSRLSSAVGVSRVKTPVPSPAGFQVISAETPVPVVGFYKKQMETSQSPDPALESHQLDTASLTKLPTKRWETRDVKSIGVSVVDNL